MMMRFSDLNKPAVLVQRHLPELGVRVQPEHHVSQVGQVSDPL